MCEEIETNLLLLIIYIKAFLGGSDPSSTITKLSDYL